MEHDKKMIELISETENLVKTLSVLKQEIESYEVAKNNLIEVKTKLAEYNESTLELTKSISQYTKELHKLVNSDLIQKINEIIKQNNSNFNFIRKSFKLTYILVGVSILLSIVSIVLRFMN